MIVEFDFLTADWHIGESRFEIMGRPAYGSQQEMVDDLVAKHNALVKPSDKVLMGGDVCFKEALEFLPQVDRFNGVKTLIRGNHDRDLTDEQLAPYFEHIVPEGEGVELEVGGVLCYATHYPHLARPDRFNLVGHIHSSWKVQKNMLNIGVDVNHMRPLAADRVPFYLSAITGFYDDDVWVAEHPANAGFSDSRGKKGTYF
ncbi:MAG: hypothetical protein JSS66_06505 [Armatimonadetes bacterium]|nr:hypothetical protein [Armatimonadota bacterium]